MRDIDASKKNIKSSSRHLLNGLILYIALPNLLLWLPTLLLKVDRPFIALEYIFTGALFAYGWKKLAALFLTIFLITDALAIQGLAYPVLHPKDILYLVSLLPHAPATWQAAAIGVTLLFAAVITISWRFSHTTDRLATLSLLGFLVLAYAVQSQMDEQSSEFERTKSTLIGSQAAYYANTRAVMVLDDLFEKIDPVYPIGFEPRISHWTNSELPPPDRILLIVVESWGTMKDQQAQQALLQPIYAMRDSFDWIEQDQTQSKPTTVEAELRYLCGLGIHYLNMKSVTESLGNCLPWQLKSHGYATTAIHGATGEMHMRKHWYPRTGFDAIHFSDTDHWQTRCHSFPGICDKEIMDSFIPKAFSQNGRQFVYWLTLNTHAPYDQRDLRLDTFNCQRHMMTEGSEACRLSKLHAQFFHDFSQALQKPEMHGVEVFIVGDHSPPLLDQREFRRHFQRDQTPLLHLRLKR